MQSQNTTKPTDSLKCYPQSVIRKMLIGAQQADALKDLVADLNGRIKELQAIITGLNESAQMDAGIIKTYQAELSTMTNQRGLYEAELKTVKKLLRKQKRKTFWTAIAGVVTTSAAIILLK